MSQVSTSVSQQLVSHLKPVASASSLAANLIQKGTLDKDDLKSLEAYVISLLHELPQTEMTYYGSANGDFVIARRKAEGQVETEIIYRSGEKPYRVVTMYDKNLAVLNHKKIVNRIVYDPRERPWYIKVKNEKKSTWSDAYIFFSG